MSIKITKLIFLISILFLGIFNSPIAYAGNPPDAAHSSLSATEVPADGTTQSTITVTLEDSSGNPLTGDSVQLSDSTNNDSTLSISPPSAVLDASGSATFTATSTTAGTDPITATDTTTSTDLSSLGQIIFDPVASPAPTSIPAISPSPATCTDAAPTDAPNLYSIIAVNGTATVYFSPPSSTFDGFTVSYGLDSDADTYSVSFSQGASSGAIKYTINSLTPNTKYYFKVSANNGCASGPWSNVLSSSGNTSLPVTGSTDLFYLGLAAVIISLGGLGVFIKF